MTPPYSGGCLCGAVRYRITAEPGTLDDTSWLRPVAHIWTRSAQPWLQFPPDAVKYETQPPETWKVLFKLWRER